MKNYILKSLLTSALVVVLSGCAEQQTYSYEFPLPMKRVTATGYGTAEKSDKYSLPQIKLMSMRASKLDAYRSLAEQVYGLRLTGSTTVQNMIATHDSYRTFVDAYLRGARVLRSVAINTDKYAGDDTFETVVELDLTPHFYQCMNGSPEFINLCLQQPMPPVAPELLTPFSSNAGTTFVATSGVHCNNMDCYAYPVTSGFDRSLVWE